ncbi:MAG TPA: hypothetical protein VFJ51_07405 [Nitrososphaeraceae archaeon]|nr:hypothetical protein [Nitrososphaeraceae archaeon]
MNSRLITSQLKQGPEYIQWLSVNRWNAQMPYAFGTGAFPLFRLPQAVLQQNQTK